MRIVLGLVTVARMRHALFSLNVAENCTFSLQFNTLHGKFAKYEEPGRVIVL